MPSQNPALSDRYDSVLNSQNVKWLTRKVLTMSSVIVSIHQAVDENNLMSLTIHSKPRLSDRVIAKFASAHGEIGRTESDGSGGRHLFNIYGPTETTIMVTMNSCNDTSKGSVIGSVLPAVCGVLLDPMSREPREVPIRLPGEFAVTGPHVALGYLNRPEESTRSFRVSAERGERMYRTGDKARMVLG